MTHDRKQQAKAYLKGSVICFFSILTICTTTFVGTHPNGTFSYLRFWICLLCWLLFLLGTILAFLAMRRSENPTARLLSVVMMTLNSIGSILGAIFLVAALNLLSLEHKVKESEAADLTNAVVLAFARFERNNAYYSACYTNAAEALRSFRDAPLSSLRSKELLKSRGTNLVNFIAACVQLREFYTHGPMTFTQEIENSGKSPKAVTNILQNFRRRDLNLWDEEYTVLDKTLQMTSNTLVLNNLLASNFDHWHISNATIVFEDTNLQMDYLESVAKVKQFRSELNMASEHLTELQHQHSPNVPANNSKQ
jgi:hypothetical protein